jgi:hypothetical protein
MHESDINRLKLPTARSRIVKNGFSFMSEERKVIRVRSSGKKNALAKKHRTLKIPIPEKNKIIARFARQFIDHGTNSAATIVAYKFIVMHSWNNRCVIGEQKV